MLTGEPALLRGPLAAVLAEERVLTERVLPAWLAKPRWCAGKGRALARVRIADIFPLCGGDDLAALVLLDVSYHDGDGERYSVLLATTADAIPLRNLPPTALIAPLAGGGALVDGLYLPGWPGELLRFIRDRRELAGHAGTLVGRPGPALRELLPATGEAPAPAVLAAEQSNTAVAFGQALLLKQYRRLEDGGGLEAEIGRALTEQAQFASVPPFAGELVYREPGGAEQGLAVLQGYVRNQGTGWDRAAGAVRDFLDRIPARAMADPPPRLNSALPENEEDFPRLRHLLSDATGADFADWLALLGRRTAELHLALAGLDDAAFRPEPYAAQFRARLLQDSFTRQERVFRRLRDRRESLPAGARPDADTLLAAGPALRARLAALAGALPHSQQIRGHGDYHLGQVLCTGHDLVITDFAGEPGRSSAERRAKCSPWRDVAGMLRSFHYAAAACPREQMRPWLDAWCDCAGMIFLRAYRATAGIQSLIPAETEACRRLLEWFLLDRVLHEIEYELLFRPERAAVPLVGLRELLRLPGQYRRPGPDDAHA